MSNGTDILEVIAAALALAAFCISVVWIKHKMRTYQPQWWHAAVLIAAAWGLS